jgi:hypothetical protein
LNSSVIKIDRRIVQLKEAIPFQDARLPERHRQGQTEYELNQGWLRDPADDPKPSPRRPRDCAVRWGRYSSCRRMRGCGSLRQPARSSWTDHRRRASNLGNRIWGLLVSRAVPPQAGLIEARRHAEVRSTLAASARRDLARGFLYTATAKSKSLRHHSSSPGLSSRVKPCAERRTASRLT